MILVVTGTDREIRAWAKKHGLTSKQYLRIRKPTTLKQFPRGSWYVTVGEWVWHSPSQPLARSTGVRSGAWEMILECECLGFRLVKELAE